MSAEVATITRFYESFAARDADGMTACYADDVTFHDPGFGVLHGDRAKAMWHMLCHAGKDLQVVASRIEGGNGTGRAHWEADYTFSTGRMIHNVVEARFDLIDGLITGHEDTFSFGAWARQAFGPIGTVGRLPGAATAFQLLSKRQLDAYIAKHG